ncbi:MAG: menaquinone biosynthesis decarboxylase [Spirochaetaceae bacterium]|nr:menaquinone biosynthesis decarboxylase [Spirochaetaceae bacterium]
MAYQGLQEFLARLEAAGELVRIRTEVDPILEITEIADRVMRKGGPALLFEKVRGSEWPLIINAYGSERRMAWALGAESLDEKAAAISELLAWGWSQLRDFSLLSTLPSALPKIPLARALLPKKVRHAPCREVVDPRGFDSLPILQCWPDDGGRFLTLPVVCTIDPETGAQNWGMYRMQVYDDRTAGMHWHIHKDGAHFFAKYSKAGRRMPVVIALGGDPAVTYASTAPLPEGIWEAMFAGFLRGKPAEVVSIGDTGILAPADAEFILEGYVDPGEMRMEGPFGDHTGFYSLPDLYPVFHLERITRRRQPVYPATIVGIPPKEDCYLAKATERLFLPLLRQLCPEITDLSMPLEGVFHNCVLVSIRKRYPGQARKVMHFLWGMGQLMYTKLIVVVDDDIELSDLSMVAWRVFNNIDASRDLVFSDGPLDALDHSSPRPRFGTRLGIDATRKLPEEGHDREWPEPLRMRKDVVELVDRRWKEYGI